MSTQADEPTEAELRAYEEELSRITSTQLILQAAASLLNVGGMRLGVAEGAQEHRDLDQVCDAIDAVKALLPILERRMPAAQARPLRDALSQLQMAYARAAQTPPTAADGAAPSQATEQPRSPGAPGSPQTAGPQPPAAGPAVPGRGPASGPAPASGQGPAQSPAGEDGEQGPGPAERSGRLWVPGR